MTKLQIVVPDDLNKQMRIKLVQQGNLKKGKISELIIFLLNKWLEGKIKP